MVWRLPPSSFTAGSEEDNTRKSTPFIRYTPRGETGKVKIVNAILSLGFASEEANKKNNPNLKNGSRSRDPEKENFNSYEDEAVEKDHVVDLDQWRRDIRQSYGKFAPHWGQVTPPAIPTFQEIRQYDGFMSSLYQKLDGKPLVCAILGATPQVRGLVVGSTYAYNVDTIDFCKEMIDNCESLVDQVTNAASREKEFVFNVEWHDFFSATIEEQQAFPFKYCGTWYSESKRKSGDIKYDVVIGDASLNCMGGEDDMVSMLQAVKGKLHEDSQILARMIVAPPVEVYPRIDAETLIAESKNRPERTGALVQQYCITNPHIRNPPASKKHREDVPIGTVDFGKYNQDVESWVKEGKIDQNFADRLRVGPLNFGDFKLYVPDVRAFKSIVKRAGYRIEPNFVNDGPCGPSFPTYVLTLSR